MDGKWHLTVEPSRNARPGLPQVNDPLEAPIAIQELKEQTIMLLRDFHLFLQDPNPIRIRKFKDGLQMAKTKSKTLIILGCRRVLLKQQKA